MANRPYECSDDEFVTIANQILDVVLVHIALIAGVLPIITVLWVTNVRNAIIAAQAMPDVSIRRNNNKQSRKDLSDAHILSKAQFGSLKLFISLAFPAAKKIQWNLAGWTFYKLTGKSNWDATAQMLVFMITYITANSVALLAAGMPANFLADLILLKADFDAAHTAYINARGNVQVQTDDKRNAFKAIFLDIRTVCQAALLTNLSPTILKQFNLTYLISVVSGTPNAGFKGTITDFHTGLPLAGATIKIFTSGLIIHANTQGKYTLSLPAKHYYAIVSVPTPSGGTPYIDQLVIFVIKKGTTSTMNIQMYH